MSKYRRLGKSAADSFIKKGEPLDDSVKKLAESEGLNPHETNRVVEHANVKAFLDQFKEAEDKTFDFDLAEPVTVNKEGEASMSDYKFAPESRKEAEDRDQLRRSAHVQLASELDRDKDEWGSKLSEAGLPEEDLRKFEDEWERAHRRHDSEKVARYHALDQIPSSYIPVDDDILSKEAEIQPEESKEATPPDHDLFHNFYDDTDWSKESSVRRTRSQVEAALDAVESEKAEKELHGKALEEQLLKQGDSAMKSGYDLPLLKKAVAKAGSDHELVNKSLDRLTEKRADAKDYRKRNGIPEKEKTAAVNDGHPLIKTAEKLIEWAEDYQEVKKQAEYLENALSTLGEWERNED